MFPPLPPHGLCPFAVRCAFPESKDSLCSRAAIHVGSRRTDATLSPSLLPGRLLGTCPRPEGHRSAAGCLLARFHTGCSCNTSSVLSPQAPGCRDFTALPLFPPGLIFGVLFLALVVESLVWT